MSFLTSIYSLRNIIDEVDIEDLTIEQYLRLTQESQTPKKIKDMTIAEYLEYEKTVSKNQIDNTKSYLLAYFGKGTPTFDPIREFAHYFGPNQPDAESGCDSEDMEEEAEYMTDDEEVMSEKEESDHGHNLYATTTLDVKDNIMPQRVYEYLGLGKLRDTSTFENTTGTNEPLGTVNILVKFRELEFPCNFIIKMVEDAIILGRPFLKSTRAQIDVFNEEISFEIGSKKFKFNIDSYQSIEKIYMVDIRQEEETFNPLEIGIDLFSYESPACLEFEQRTRYYGTPNLQDEIAEPISFSPDRRGLVKRWHVCKPVHVTYDDGNGEYCEMWPTCDLDSAFCFGYNELFGVNGQGTFNNEIKHLSNEYILRIGKKGYVLDDVWEKCQQNYKKTNEAWHDEAYEEDEMWRIGNEKSDYDPHYVNVNTFEVKKYSFKGGRSFICITDREDEALPSGHINGA
ncbi:phospholipase-like protein [Tanacetum coccineum]